LGYSRFFLLSNLPCFEKYNIQTGNSPSRIDLSDRKQAFLLQMAKVYPVSIKIACDFDKSGRQKYSFSHEQVN